MLPAGFIFGLQNCCPTCCFMFFSLLILVEYPQINKERTEVIWASMQNIYTTGRRSQAVSRKIICDGGETTVQYPGIYAYYKYRLWLFKVNPIFLFPGLRREHRKSVYVNEKKYGYAEMRYGCIPMSKYRYPGKGFFPALVNFFRFRLGLGCPPEDRGYFLVNLRHQKYIILRRLTKDGNTLCEVYFQPTEERVGTFVFDKDFTKVYPMLGEGEMINTMFVIMGYVADLGIYSAVASELNRTIDVIYN